MKICKTFTFDAAHKLPNYDGKCAQLHGHTYKLEVTFTGALNKNTGMVIDFGELSDIVKESVIEPFDHSYLNDRINNPTAENLAMFIYDTLGNKTELCIFDISIKLWETPTSWVEYDGTD